MKDCAVLDILLGIVAVALQVQYIPILLHILFNKYIYSYNVLIPTLKAIFLALGYTGLPVYMMSGFWAGVIFCVTGAIALSNEYTSLNHFLK